MVRQFHDDGDAGFIISAQQCGSICCDDGLAFGIGQFRTRCRCDDFRRITRQCDVIAIEVVDHIWLNALAGGFRRCVNVRVKRDNRRAIDIAGNGSHDDAKLVLSRISDAHSQHLFDQQLSHFQLSRTAGVPAAVLHRSGVDLHVLKKTIKKSLAIHGAPSGQ